MREQEKGLGVIWATCGSGCWVNTITQYIYRYTDIYNDNEINKIVFIYKCYVTSVNHDGVQTICVLLTSLFSIKPERWVY